MGPRLTTKAACRYGFVLLAIVAAPASATEVFRCIKASGAVEYRDSACSPSAIEKASVEIPVATPAQNEEARRALRDIHEQTRELDMRAIARMNAAREAREAAGRDVYQGPTAEPMGSPYIGSPYF